MSLCAIQSTPTTRRRRIVTCCKLSEIQEILGVLGCARRRPEPLRKVHTYSPIHGTPVDSFRWCLGGTREGVVLGFGLNTMSMERYLRALDSAFRNHDGPSMARYLSANAGDIPSAKDFVPYMQQVCCALPPRQRRTRSPASSFQPHA